MKAYKGFDKGMKCRGFQYEEGQTYELPEGEKANLCNNGFHACEAPLDCFRYYRPSDSVFHEVELEGVTDETSDDSKRVGSKIKIGARLACARGNGVKVRGDLGAVLVVAVENDTDYDIKEWKAGVVDGDVLKPGIWYTVHDGEWMEVETDET